MNLCFAVAQNEVPVDIFLELHDALVLETAMYNAHIWCHYKGWALKIRIGNLDRDESACTWGECCTEAYKRMAGFVIVKITNGETIRKW